MEIINVEGIVLKSVKYNESSKIINILTKEYGLIGVMAKGALKPKSSLRVLSENFSYASFQISYKKDKISTLIEADTIDYFLNIKSDLEKYSYLNYLAELTYNVYKENSSADIYDIFKNAILKIEEGYNPKVITNIVEVKYLDYLGIGLYLDGCVVCAKTSVSTISISKGGFVCANHRGIDKEYLPNTIKMIKAYYYVDISKISDLKIKEDVINEIDEFLTLYYKEYTGLYLKSKKFLKDIK